MYYEIAKDYQGAYEVFRPYAPAKDREAWAGVDAQVKDAVIRQAQENMGYAYPMLPATKYMEFCRIGNRKMYEDLYFDRRRILNVFVLAECAEHQGRFLDDIINGVMAICEESGWQLPAHNNYLNTETYCLPDRAEPIIDLFAAETAELLSMTSYLLKDELDQVTPLVTKRIHDEVGQRILIPYLGDKFHWMGGWNGAINNWTPWITQNVLISLFSREDLTDHQKRLILHQATKSLDYFLETYGEDGCCNEGAGYYRAAGLCLFNATEVLNQVTNGAFMGMYGQEKIKNIAPYIMNVHVDDRYYANFNDCSPTAGRAGAREYLFAKRVGNEDMMRFAALDHSMDNGYLNPRTENLFYRLQAAFLEKELKQVDLTKPIHKKDLFYESVGLLIARDSSYFVGVKAGCNNDSHNHNDVGSITVYKDGKPMLIDVGVETYSRKTFSKDRYDIWTMQSLYHNVVNFGEVSQLAGPEYRADVQEVELSEDKAAITMELAGAYPEQAVGSYVRRVVFEKGKRITITDSIRETPEGACLTFMTLGKPEWDGSCLSIENSGSLRIQTDGEVKIERIVLQDEKLKGEWGECVYRTLVSFGDGSQVVTVIGE